MMFKMFAGLVALIGLSLFASCAAQTAAQGTYIDVTRAELDAALARTLAESRDVDFPEKTRFTELRFVHEAGLGIAGQARFFDPRSGDYPPPDIAFFGMVPLGYWRVENGALTFRLVAVDGIAPVPRGESADSDLAEAIRDSLSTGVGDLMSRMSFPTGLDPDRRWIIGSAEVTPEAIRFELRAR